MLTGFGITFDFVRSEGCLDVHEVIDKNMNTRHVVNIKLLLIIIIVKIFRKYILLKLRNYFQTASEQCLINNVLTEC